ncbi:MAG: hypothetical protein ABEI98_11830 [Halorhabdus sp.]
MEPEVLGDLVAPSRRSDDLAYRHTDKPARSHTADSLCTTAWQTANLLRLYGVHEGATVGIVDAPKRPDGEPGSSADRAPGTPIPEVIVTLFGASLLGAVVRFDPPASFDGSALVCPADWTDADAGGPGCTVVAYGGPPSEPGVVHFESEVWSETPIEPPESVAPGAAVLTTGERTVDHATVLSVAERIGAEYGFTAGDAVAIGASLSRPETVVAGVIAPLLVGGTIQVGSGTADHRVGAGGIDPAAITLRPTDGRNSRA